MKFCNHGYIRLLTIVVMGVLFPFKSLMYFKVRFIGLLSVSQLKCFPLFFLPDVKSKELVKTCQSYEKLINFLYKG